MNFQALHLAASEGHYEAADFLINAGANVNVMDRWGSTPLQDAITASHDRVAELLMKHGARVEKDTQKIKVYHIVLQESLDLFPPCSIKQFSNFHFMFVYD
jgi:ankyrin repeat protein